MALVTDSRSCRTVQAAVAAAGLPGACSARSAPGPLQARSHHLAVPGLLSRAGLLARAESSVAVAVGWSPAAVVPWTGCSDWSGSSAAPAVAGGGTGRAL